MKKKNTIETWGLITHLGQMLFQFGWPKQLGGGFNGSCRPSEMLSMIDSHKKLGLNVL